MVLEAKVVRVNKELVKVVPEPVNKVAKVAKVAKVVREPASVVLVLEGVDSNKVV